MIGISNLKSMLQSIYEYIVGFNGRIERLILNKKPKMTDVVKSGSADALTSNGLYTYYKNGVIPTKLVCSGSFYQTFVRAITLAPNSAGELVYDGFFIMCGSTQLIDNTGLLYIRVSMTNDSTVDETTLNTNYTHIIPVGDKKCYITAVAPKFVVGGANVYIQWKITNGILYVYLVSPDDYTYANLECYGINNEPKKGVATFYVKEVDRTYCLIDQYMDGVKVIDGKQDNISTYVSNPGGTRINFAVL